MRLSSSTWRSRLAVAAALAGLGVVALAGLRAVASARPWPCLPPVFDGGQRLHPLPSPRVHWLELLLRQHELCWGAPAGPDEQRVVLIGSSAVYGFPNPVEDTFGGQLNRHFAQAGVPARLYNLAFVNPSQVRDALIIHDALPYRPDVILYPMTLAEFQHMAPVPFQTIIDFFESNRASVASLAAEEPPGLEEPLGRWQAWLEKRPWNPAPVAALRASGAFLRVAAGANAQWVVERLHSRHPFTEARKRVHQTDYKCEDIRARVGTNFRNWQAWNVLAYLQHLRETTGIEVLIVAWPVVYEPVEDCYDSRFTKAAVEEYTAWLAEETRTRNLPYLDLHAFLPPDGFVDSIHLGPDGHRRVAEQVAATLDPMLERLAERRRQAAAR